MNVLCGDSVWQSGENIETWGNKHHSTRARKDIEKKPEKKQEEKRKSKKWGIEWRGRRKLRTNMRITGKKET